MEKKLRQFTISPKGEKTIQFIEEVITAGLKVAKDAEDEDEDEDATSANRYTIKSENEPHKDLWECMKDLKKHAMDVCEIGIAGKELGSWSVTGIKVAGDVVMKKSRVQLQLSKYVKRTKKTISFWSPQVTMYPDKSGTEVEYENVDKLTEVVEALIDEVFAYIAGKYQEDGQLPLFVDERVAV